MEKQDRVPGERGPKVLVAVALMLGLLFVAWVVSNALRGRTPPDVTPPDGTVDPGGRVPEPGSPEGADPPTATP